MSRLLPEQNNREQKRFEAVVHGRVQGVGFRYAAQDQGIALGLRGFVRNCSDGTVLVMAQGPAPAVDRFLAWLQQGPRLAHVSQVQVNWQIPQDDLLSFEVRF